MIRCVRIWTGDDGQSHFEEGKVDLPGGSRGDDVGPDIAARSISFRETRPGGAFDWHDAPARQFVLTLSGTLQFETHSGATFTIRPGDALLAEDTAGGGHRWRLMDDSPWRRAYIILEPGADARFVPDAR